MKKARLAVFISGRGSHLKNLIEWTDKGHSTAEIVLVVSDNPDAQGLRYAQQAKIQTFVTHHYDGRGPFAREAQLVLDVFKVDFVILAGFMRILDSDFVTHWEGRIVNIHPSLLPEFPGLHPQRQAIEAGAHVSGCTVHHVIPEVDAGPAIAQVPVPIHDGDTEESLSARILEAEHMIYPLVIDLLIQFHKSVV
jgi:phosphoribosylglycinamide formyltransferase-1